MWRSYHRVCHDIIIRMTQTIRCEKYQKSHESNQRHETNKIFNLQVRVKLDIIYTFTTQWIRTTFIMKQNDMNTN